MRHSVDPQVHPLEKIKLCRLFTKFREGTPWTEAKKPLCP
jgi:hypothetical protein